MDHNKLWEILKEMGIPDHLFCLLRNLYVDQEATVRTRHETADWFKTGREHQVSMLLPCLFELHAESIMRNPEWMTRKLKASLPGKMPIASDMQMTPLL